VTHNEAKHRSDTPGSLGNEPFQPQYLRLAAALLWLLIGSLLCHSRRLVRSSSADHRSPLRAVGDDLILHRTFSPLHLLVVVLTHHYHHHLDC
jgi:hypothetical protein